MDAKKNRKANRMVGSGAKRIHYSANQVHDFACRHRSMVFKTSKLEKPDGEVIDIWTASLDQKNGKKQRNGQKNGVFKKR